MIGGSAKEIDGLYIFEVGYDLSGQTQRTCFNSSFACKDNEIMLWHYKLGHPSFSNLNYLFPEFLKNKNPSSFIVKLSIS